MIILQVERLTDRYGRCQEVDVFINLTAEGYEELKDVDYVVSHAGAADTNPRVVIPTHGGKKEEFAYLKECSDEVLEKLYKNQG